MFVIALLKGDSYTDSLSCLLLLSIHVPVSSESQKINNRSIACTGTSVCWESLRDRHS